MKSTGEEEVTTLVQKDSVEEPLALVGDREPTSVPAIFALADMLFERARTFVPKGINDPAELVAVILTGQEMGMGPMTSMRTLYIVNGKVSLSSEGMLAFALRGGVSATWMETSAEEAVLKLERKGAAPFTIRFTIEEAKRAKLTGKYVWKSYPAAMLRNRCVSAGIRAFCPDVLLGAYVPEEMSSMGYAANWEPVEGTGFNNNNNNNNNEEDDGADVIDL